MTQVLEDTDVVVFRRWRDCGDIIALFPEIPADLFSDLCEAYEHESQHGGANYWSVIQQTLPVNVEEAAALAEELERVGYNLRPVKRASLHHHEKRRQAARECALA